MIARLRLYLLLGLVALLLVTVVGLFFRARRAERQLGAAAAEVARLTGKVAEAEKRRTIQVEDASAKRMVAAGARVVARAQATVRIDASAEGPEADVIPESVGEDSAGVPSGEAAIAASDSHGRFHIRIPVSSDTEHACFRLTGEPTQWLIRQRFVISNLWFAAGDRRFTGATLTELAPDTGEALGVYEADAADLAAEWVPVSSGGLKRFGWTAGFYGGLSAVDGSPDGGVGIMWGVRW